MIRMCTIAKLSTLQLRYDPDGGAPDEPAVNRQVLLASRPEGIPQAEHFGIVESAGAGARPGPGAGAQRLAVGRAGDARLGQRGGQLLGAGRHRRGDALVRRRPRRRVERPGLAGRHAGHRPVRLAGLRGGRRQRDPAPCRGDRPAAVDGARRARHQRRHRALRPARRSASRRSGETVVVSTAAGAVGSCVGQIAKLQGLPHRRHHGRRRRSASCAWSASATTPRSTTRPPTSTNGWPRPAPTASTSTSTTPPGRSATR